MTAMGRGAEEAFQVRKLSQWGAERAKAENTQQGKSQVIFSPLHLDVVGQLHRAVLSLVSQVDAVQMLGGERSAEISTPQMFPHMQANKPNEEIRNKDPQTLRIWPNF